MRGIAWLRRGPKTLRALSIGYLTDSKVVQVIANMDGLVPKNVLLD